MATSSKKIRYRHILLVRLSALGDVAKLAHTVRAFKEAYPEVKVTVLTREFLRPMFDGLDVDFIFADTKGKHKGFCGIWRLAGEVKRAGVDAIADTHGMLRSRTLRWMCWLRGFIPFKAIRKGRVEKWFRLGYNRASAVQLKHTVVRYNDVLRRLGFDFDDPAPVTKPSLPCPMGTKEGRWVGFAPFSAHEGKTYPADMRAELVRLLAERYDRVFIHSGGGDEAAFAEQMEATYPNVTALWGKVKLREERDLISHLDGVVTMDSLVMHLASLVATPTVSIWGATHPQLGFMGYGMGDRGILQAEMPCRPCSVYGNKRCKFGDYRCLRAITPDMVIERLDEILEK